jgi:hypothetical protein
MRLQSKLDIRYRLNVERLALKEEAGRRNAHYKNAGALRLLPTNADRPTHEKIFPYRLQTSTVTTTNGHSACGRS